LVLVPVGSTEQHGPHLPFDTDTRIATAVTEGVAARLRAEGASVVVAPALAYGASGEHQQFAGTVSIGHEALRFVLVELIRSLSTWAGRTVLVNGHGGNVATLTAAVAQLRTEGHPVDWAPCALAPGAASSGHQPDAHAGRTETSLMLHLDQGAVRLPLPPAGNIAPMRDLLPHLMRSGVAAVSASGVLGDPGGATAAEGQELLDAMTAETLRRVRRGAGAAADPSARPAGIAEL
jgi:creatinine amidohydrolase